MKHRFIGIITLVLILSVLLILPLAAQAYDDGTTCSNSNTGKHEFEVYKSQDVTCEQDGYIDWICMICKHQARQVTGKATGHNWQEQIREQPTCTKEGYGIEICTRCGRTKDNGHRIPALGHNYQRKVAQEATCTKDGTAVYTCSRCGDSYREPIPATGHKWGAWHDGNPATCVQYGNRYHQCTRCGQKEWERNYAGGLGDHDWGEWVTVKEPTATESGLEERTCKVDASHKEQREIPSNGKAELTINCYLSTDISKQTGMHQIMLRLIAVIIL